MERKKKNKTKKKMAFSKKGWVINMVMVILITVVAIVHSFVSGIIGGDPTVYTFLIPAAWAELAVYSGFLLKKSEKENTKDGIIYDLAMKEKDEQSQEVQRQEEIQANAFDCQFDGLGDSSNDQEIIEDASKI